MLTLVGGDGGRIRVVMVDLVASVDTGDNCEVAAVAGLEGAPS